VKLRNRKAIELGYKNYAEMILEITELGADWFHSFVKTIDEATLIPYQDLLANIKTEESEKHNGIADSRKLMLQYSMMYVSYPLHVQNYLIADIIS
jgi:hypothetical protein